MSGYADSAHVSPAKKDLQNDSEPPVYFKPSDIPPNYEDSQAHCEAEQRFVSQRVWNDVWAIVFYYLNFLFFCGLCGFGIYTLIDRNDEGVLLTFKGKTISNDNLTNSTVENALTVKMISTALPVAIGISVVMTFIYGLIVYFFTVAMIVISYFFSVVIFLGCGAYLIYLRAYVAGGILCGVGMLVALMFCCIYSRIGFTAQLIKTVMLVVSRYPSITLVPIVAMFLQIGVALLWGYGLSGCKLRFGSNTGGMIGISIFLIFSFFWNAQFINNSLHTACSGVFCAYYFLGETVQMPKRPVKIAIRNAVGPGSGSIALGSLIVAIIQTLRTVVKLLAGKNSNAVMQCISCFLNCILGAVEATAKYFNRYAFVLVSIYGKSFYQSAKVCSLRCKVI